jgi:hypothetical protein
MISCYFPISCLLTIRFDDALHDLSSNGGCMGRLQLRGLLARLLPNPVGVFVYSPVFHPGPNFPSYVTAFLV